MTGLRTVLVKNSVLQRRISLNLGEIENLSCFFMKYRTQVNVGADCQSTRDLDHDLGYYLNKIPIPKIPPPAKLKLISETHRKIANHHTIN